MQVEIAQVHLLPVKGLVNISNIRETTIAMMETTIAGVTMMVGIVVVLMSRRITAKNVNALTQRLMTSLHVKGLVNLRNIKETVGAMTETTIAGVNMMVGIVVVLTSRRNTAKLVNALTQRLSFIC